MANESLMSSPLGRPQQSFCTFSNIGVFRGSQSGNNLECRVCEEGFSISGEKVPRLLYCGHTLCHACLLRLPLCTSQDTERADVAGLSRGGLICCPFDRQPTPVDSTGVWGLKKNFALLEVLERCSSGGGPGGSGDDEQVVTPVLSPELLMQYQQCSNNNSNNVPCDEDESHIAVLYCTVCSSHLCHACSERSHAPRTLHTHRRIPIADKPREKPRCLAHPTHTVEFVCLEPACANSSPLMCFICKDYKHAKHEHALLETEAESVRVELVAASHNVRRLVLQLTVTLRKLEQAASELDEQPSEAFNDRDPVSSDVPSSSSTLSAFVQSDAGAAPQHSHNTFTHTPPNAPVSSTSASGAAGIHLSSGSISVHSSVTSAGNPMTSTPATTTTVHVSSAPSISTMGHTNASISLVSTAIGAIRDHFTALRQQLQVQETTAVGALETHVRERLCSIRQHHDDLSSLASQMVGLVLETERCLQHDDSRVLVSGRGLSTKMQLLQQQHAQLDSAQLGLDVIQDTIPITFTKDNRIHIGAVLEMRVVTLGLDGAGKTSILFKLQQDTCPPTIPTIGFNVETLHYKNFKFTIWDVGGQPKLRPLWRHYYYNTQAVMFVVDATDPARIEEATAELSKLMMERELRDAPLLILANKQGVPGALSPSDVSLAMAAGTLCSGRPWHVVGSDAVTGEGLTDGLDWLTLQLGPHAV